VRLGPEHPLFHFPEVDDIADEIEVLALDGTEKAQEMVGATATKTQMDIGNPHGAVR
jgi:hypothetical protein